MRRKITPLPWLGLLLWLSPTAHASESWTQPKFDSRHSGNVPDRAVSTPLGLLGAVPLSDAIFTSPVVAAGRACAVDEGTVKHFSTCGGGRLYTHTAEGQNFAVEQETGRLT